MTKIGILTAVLAMAVSFWLLLGVTRLQGGKGDWLRTLFGALVIGVHSGVVMLLEGRLLERGWMHLAAIALSGFIAFGKSRNGAKLAVQYGVLMLALEGAAGAEGGARGLCLLVLAALIGWICKSCGQKQAVEGRYVPVEVLREDQIFHFTALRDTGNLLTDPITGEPVLILGGTDAAALSGLTRKQLADPFRTILEHPVSGLRLIPYRSLGNPCGFLLAMRFPHVRIDGEIRSAVIAFAYDSFRTENGFQALIGGVA